jgi:hypothetical protein
MNQELLLNIVRASRYQPLNFMVITQLNGGQTETLNTGLPTITFGPAQTAAQHQFPISNSVTSAATGGYQTNPLVSSQFQQGMMSPVTPKVLTYLLASHDRETVFNLVVDSINVTMGTTTVRYVNDPANDSGPGGCDVKSVSIALDAPGAQQLLLAEDICNYSKFLSFMLAGLQYGVSAELVPAPATSTGARGAAGQGAGGAMTGQQQVGGTTNATVQPQATGRLCWDQGLAILKYKPAYKNDLKAICGTKPDEKYSNSSFTFKKLGKLQFDIHFRSPAAIFIALGKMLREGSAQRVTPQLDDARRVFDGEPLLTVTEKGGDCYVSVNADGRSYCVPQYALRSAAVIDILFELKNLSITPNDLNSAFSVRVLN